MGWDDINLIKVNEGSINNSPTTFNSIYVILNHKLGKLYLVILMKWAIKFNIGIHTVDEHYIDVP